MSYIRDGYVFVSPSKKVGRKGYGHVGRCVFLVGKNKDVQFKNIKFPKIYWGQRIRLKVEVLEDKNGMPKPEEKIFTVEDLKIIKEEAYRKGYSHGYIDRKLK